VGVWQERLSPRGSCHPEATLNLARILNRLLWIAAIAACSKSSGTEPVVDSSVLTGKWGGPDVGIDATVSPVTAHFDFCAEGTLTSPVLLTPEGRFDVPGTYVRNIGPSIQAKSARYVGLWRQKSLTLTVFLSEPLGPNNSDVVGPFDLELGKAGPPIKPCPIVY
jgi:hypothetical protein